MRTAIPLYKIGNVVVFALLTLTTSFGLYSQNEFSKLFGTEFEDQATKVVAHSNSIYVLGFQNDSSRRITFRKYDINGNLIWQIFYPNNTSPSDFIIDGTSIYIVGRTIPDGNDNYPLISKIQDLGSFYKEIQTIYLDYDSFRQRLSGILKLSPNRYVINTSIGGISDDASMTIIDSSLNVISYKKFDLSDDQLYYGPFLDLGNTISISGDESDAQNNGFILNVNDDLDQLKSTYYFGGVRFIRDIAVDTVNNQRLILSNDEITLTNADYLKAISYRINGNSTNRSLEGPFFENDSTTIYFFTSTLLVNDTLKSALTKVKVSENDLELEWTKRLDGAKSGVGSFNYFINNVNQYIYVDSRVDSINGFGNSDIYISVLDENSCLFTDITYSLSLLPAINPQSASMVESIPSNPIPAISNLVEEFGTDSYTFPDCPVMDTCLNTFLHFDGINDRIVIPNSYPGNVEFTLECLFKSENDSDDGPGNTFHRLFTIGTFDRFEVGDDVGTLVYYNGQFNSFGPSIRDDKWHHLAIVKTSNSVLAFIDGNLQLDLPEPNVNIGSLRIGYFDNNSIVPPSIWKGGIDEIKLWDYALSENEIVASRLKSNLSKQDCGLIGYWALEDGIPNSNNTGLSELFDSTGNNNGTPLDFGFTGEVSNFLCHDSIVIDNDASGCCQVSIFHSTQCNIINLNSAPIGFEDEKSVTYQWSSPNTNFSATVPDTIWTYNGDRKEVIICLEATDGNCTAGTCDTIQIIQPEPPILEGCIEEISLPYLENCEAFVDFPVPIAIDPCTNEEVVVICIRSDDLALDDPFPIGSTMVTCIATGITGLTETCITEVLITDEIPPECVPTTIQFLLDENGTASIQLADIPAPAIDECSETFFSNPEQIIAVDCFPSAGMTVDVEDKYGNTTQCLLIFEVSDTIIPSCIIADQIIASEAGEDSITVVYNYEVLDNCPNPSVRFSIPEGSKIPCGFNSEVTMYVEDNFGNQDSCVFNLSVTGCEEFFSSICGNVFEDFNCNRTFDDVETPLAGIQIGLFSPFGLDTLAILTTDATGKYSLDSIPASRFLIRPILSGEEYGISFPLSQEYDITIDSFDTFENLDFGLSYNGMVLPIPFEKVCYMAGDTIRFEWDYNQCSPIGNIILFRSICGNEMFSQVQNGIENDGLFEYVIPTDNPDQIIEFGIIGPGSTGISRFNCIEINDLDIDFNFELIGCKEFEFTATDDSYLSYEWSYGDGIVDQSEATTTTHAYSNNEVYNVCLTIKTAFDCESTICKTLMVDGDCNDCNIAFESEDVNCYKLGFTVSELNYETNVSYQWTVDGNFVSENKEPFIDLGGPGTYEVCLTGTDFICSDQFCRTFTKDTVFAEFLNCPSEKIVYSIDENCSPVFHTSTIELGAFCHIGDANVPEIIYTRSDGNSISESYEMGVTSVTASFTDLYGITSSCNFEIEVIDDTPPICNINPIINLGLDENGQATLEPFMVDNGSTDNCGEVEIMLSQTSFNCNDIGEQEITVTISDGTNETTCSTLVKIEDKLPPMCTLEDTDIYIDENGNFEISLNTIDFTAQDNCGEPTVSLIGAEDVNCNTVSSFDIGIIVTDQNGNSTECNAVINLRDTFPPECIDMSAEFIMTPQLLGEPATVIVEITDYRDNCGIDNGQLTFPVASCETVGENIAIQSITDYQGNTTSCNVIITIIDAIPPTCDIADLDIQATEDNGAIVTFDGTATDPCNDEIDITYSMPSGGFYECGEYTITMTATDEHGNASSCDFNLIVRDCGGCCQSESAFMGLTNQGFDTEAMFQNGTTCIVQLLPPALTDCQFITQLDWDDGTVTNGQFPSNLEFIHEYADVGIYNVCITMEETDSGSCFSNQVCKTIEVTSECSLITNIEEIKANDISVYPNPTNGYLVIQSGYNMDQIHLYNFSGKLILENLNERSINLSDLKAGVYLLRIKVGSQFIMKKIVKID